MTHLITPDQQLHETLAAYGLDTAQLRTLITEGQDIRRALSGDTIPEALDHVLTLLQAIVLPDERTQIRSHIDAAAFFMTTLGHHVQEQFWVICLDTKNRIQHAQMIYTGTIDSIHMRACEVFRPAIQHNSAAIIVAHNHPSTDPSPSPEDVLMTAQLYAAGELLAIDLLDHLIIGQGRWQSLRDRGLGFPKKG